MQKITKAPLIISLCFPGRAVLRYQDSNTRVINGLYHGVPINSLWVTSTDLILIFFSSFWISSSFESTCRSSANLFPFRMMGCFPSEVQFEPSVWSSWHPQDVAMTLKLQHFQQPPKEVLDPIHLFLLQSLNFISLPCFSKNNIMQFLFTFLLHISYLPQALFESTIQMGSLILILSSKLQKNDGLKLMLPCKRFCISLFPS